MGTITPTVFGLDADARTELVEHFREPYSPGDERAVDDRPVEAERGPDLGDFICRRQRPGGVIGRGIAGQDPHENESENSNPKQERQRA